LWCASGELLRSLLMLSASHYFGLIPGLNAIRLATKRRRGAQIFTKLFLHVSCHCSLLSITAFIAGNWWIACRLQHSFRESRRPKHNIQRLLSGDCVTAPSACTNMDVEAIISNADKGTQ